MGIFPLVISDLKMHKKSNGDLILHEGNPAVIVSFTANVIKLGIKTDESIESNVHQEMYWIGSTNYTKLQKIILQVGLNPNEQINKKDIVGKQIWGVIIMIHHVLGAELMRTEAKLKETFEFSDSPPKYKKDLIEYKTEGF